jgi:tripartite ATP-independent transporter DctP family solute receptor
MLTRRDFLKVSGAGLAGVALVGVTGCGAGTGADGDSTVVLKLAHHLAQDTTEHKAYEEIAEIVREKTGNTLEIQIFPNQEMGDAREVIEGVTLGTVDMGMASHALLSAYVPEYGIYDLPFLFKDYEHLGKVLDSDITAGIDEKMLEQKGARSLGWSFAGFRDVVTSTKPIREAADFKGMKFRVPESEVYVETFRALGARPTSVPWGETYTALETGLVDGMENSPVQMLASKMYEPTKYYTETGHQQSSHTILINEQKWQSLSSEQQKAMQEAVATVIPKERKAIEQEAEEAKEEMEQEGLEMIQIKDPENLVEAVEPVKENYGKQVNGLDVIKEIEALGLGTR